MSEDKEEVVIPSKEELLGTDEEGGDPTELETEESKEYSDIEKEAMSQGWNPEGVEGKRNLTPEEFVDRKKLYDDLHKVKSMNKRLQKDMENVTKYQERIREDERKKVMAELKTAKAEAMAEEDYGKVADIDEQILEERESAKQEKLESSSKVNEDFDTWVSDNSWYQTDSDLKAEADVYGETYWARNPTKSREDVYEAVSKFVKKAYPEKFGNEKRTAPNAVEGKTQPTASKAKSKFSAKDLPEEERQMMRTILRTSNLTEEEYLKEYHSMNG